MSGRAYFTSRQHAHGPEASLQAIVLHLCVGRAGFDVRLLLIYSLVIARVGNSKSNLDSLAPRGPTSTWSRAEQCSLGSK